MLITNIILQEARELRKNFLMHLLKYHKNEARDNIPDIVRQYLRGIKEHYIIYILLK
jgi:hypothetical protein